MSQDKVNDFPKFSSSVKGGFWGFLSATPPILLYKMAKEPNQCND